jgi:hypothetical protein
MEGDITCGKDIGKCVMKLYDVFDTYELLLRSMTA